MNITGERGVEDTFRRQGISLKLKFQINEETRRRDKTERVEYNLLCFALHYYLLEPEGEPAIAPERE